MSDDNIYEIHRYGRVTKPVVETYTPPQLPLTSTKAIQHFAMIDLQDNLHRLNYIHAQLKTLLQELEVLVQK